MLDFQSFCKELSVGLDFSGIDVFEPEMNLFDELGVDSLGAYELLLLTEELAGLEDPPGEVPPLFTLADAFDYYLQGCRAANETGRHDRHEFCPPMTTEVNK